MDKNSNPWIKRFNTSDKGKLVLVCLPFAGGGTSSYRDWVNDLPAEVEILAIELPGRESRLREKPISDLGEVISQITSALMPQINGRPFVVFGHSLGALLGFELIRLFRRESYDLPLCFLASGREAPTEKEPGRDLHNLPDFDFINEMVSRYDGIPRQLLNEPELLELFLPAMKADLKLTETYQYQYEMPFDFPLHIMSGKQDTRLTQELLMPWSQQTFDSAPLSYFDGGHFFIRDSAKQVKAYIAEVLQQYLPVKRDSVAS